MSEETINNTGPLPNVDDQLLDKRMWKVYRYGNKKYYGNVITKQMYEVLPPQFFKRYSDEEIKEAREMMIQREAVKKIKGNKNVIAGSMHSHFPTMPRPPDKEDDGTAGGSAEVTIIEEPNIFESVPESLDEMDGENDEPKAVDIHFMPTDFLKPELVEKCRLLGIQCLGGNGKELSRKDIETNVIVFFKNLHTKQGECVICYYVG